ncbi:MAG: hypothetical protein H8D67_27015 [Deltaproteobacteria bacterium]|nr:hypothetical protein [Deltaproteobacteria bacterium]
MSLNNSFLSLTILALALLVGLCVYADELTSIDIGDALNKPGSYEEVDGTYTIIGAGHDIWGNADGFRFAYLSLSGDFEAVVRIVSFERVDKWAKAGLMARQSVDANAKNTLSTAAAGVAGEPLGVQLTWRADTGGESFELNYWERGGPSGFNDGEWIRLTRKGNDFSASWSKDGKEWVDDYASVTVQMNDPILVGLAVTSCDANLLCKAVFDNFTILSSGKQIFPSRAVRQSGKLATTWGEIKSNY